MKKRIMAVYALAGVLAASPILTSCVDNDESASITNIRNANKAQFEAVAAQSRAQIEMVKVAADAEVELLKAQTAFEQAQMNSATEELAALKAQFAAKVEQIKAESERDLIQLQLQMKEYDDELSMLEDKELFYLYSQLQVLQKQLEYSLKDKLDIQSEIILVENNIKECENDVEPTFLKEEIAILENKLNTLTGLRDSFKVDNWYGQMQEAKIALTLASKESEKANLEASVARIKLFSSILYAETDSYDPVPKFLLNIFNDFGELKSFFENLELSTNQKPLNYFKKLADLFELIEKYNGEFFELSEIKDLFTISNFEILTNKEVNPVPDLVDLDVYQKLAVNPEKLIDFEQYYKTNLASIDEYIGKPSEGENPATGLYLTKENLEEQLAETTDEQEIIVLKLEISNVKTEIEEAIQLRKEEVNLKQNIDSVIAVCADDSPESVEYENIIAGVQKEYKDVQALMLKAVELDKKEQEILTKLDVLVDYCDENGFFELDELIADLKDDLQDMYAMLQEMSAAPIEATCYLNYLKECLESDVTLTGLVQKKIAYVQGRIDSILNNQKE